MEQIENTVGLEMSSGTRRWTKISLFAIAFVAAAVWDFGPTRFSFLLRPPSQLLLRNAHAG
jgi:hypothetical protein